MNVINLIANGSWQELPLARGMSGVVLQARTAADFSIRGRGQIAYFTVKSGTSLTLPAGMSGPKSWEVLAANGVVIEAIASGAGYA